MDKRATERLMQMARSHNWAQPLAAALAHSGDGILWVALGLTSLALASPPGRLAALKIAAAVALTAIIVGVLKLVIRRPRPTCDGSRWSALPRHDRYAFPSGHSARAACIALGVAGIMPRLGPILVLWALAVSMARVAIGAHHVLDVIAGLLVGLGGALLIVWLWPTLTGLW